MIDIAALDAISMSAVDGPPLSSSDMNDEGIFDAFLNFSIVDKETRDMTYKVSSNLLLQPVQPCVDIFTILGNRDFRAISTEPYGETAA